MRTRSGSLKTCAMKTGNKILDWRRHSRHWPHSEHNLPERFGWRVQAGWRMSRCCGMAMVIVRECICA
jgi:hypothetical protein